MSNNSFIKRIIYVRLINKNTSKALRQIDEVCKTLDSESAELLRSVAEALKDRVEKIYPLSLKYIEKTFDPVFSIINKMKEGLPKRQAFLVKLLAHYINNSFNSNQEWYLNNINLFDDIEKLKFTCSEIEQRMEEIRKEINIAREQISDIARRVESVEFSDKEIEGWESYYTDLMSRMIYMEKEYTSCENRLKELVNRAKELEKIRRLIEGNGFDDFEYDFQSDSDPINRDFCLPYND